MPEDRTAGQLAAITDAQGHTWFKPEDTHDGDDPRWVAWVAISDLKIDTSVQRDLVGATLSRITREGWQWARAEALSVARREDGALVVVEGQHRTEYLRQVNPAIRILCVLAGVEGESDEARTALAISRSRTSHSMYSMWEGLVVAGDPHVLAAVKVMDARGLRVSHGRTGLAVSAPSSVIRIISGTVAHPRDAEEGAELLGRVLDAAACVPVSMDAEADRAGARWDGSMLTAIANVITKAERDGIALRADRLHAAMQRHDVSAWLAFARRTSPRWKGIAAEITAGYNHGLKREGESRI